MSNQSSSELASDLDPIIVTSPVIRSGTTLLQRLLCSSSNALIYGEESAKDLELLLQIYASRLAAYSHSRQKFSVTLEKVLDGDVNDWIMELMPEIDGYMNALRQTFLAGLTFCRDYAAQVNRPVWGIKYPGWSPHFLSLLRQVLPDSRFIVIYRDVVESLRSAKARGSVNSEREARQFCQDWRNNLAFMLRMKDDPSVLLVNFAELVTEPERMIEMIAGFTGIRDMQRETLRHKINTRLDEDSKTMSQPGYIEPAGLTEAEQRMAEQAAAALNAGQA